MKKNPKALLLVAGIATVLSTKAIAQSSDCLGLWIQRNARFNEVGYCFKSILGRSYFDNAGCTRTAVPLEHMPEWRREKVLEIKSRERKLRCQIDTQIPMSGQ